MANNWRETLDQFSDYLRKSERAAHTINGYLRDLVSFSRWLSETRGEELDPARIAPTDVREYKQYLQINKELRPSSINRSLASLRCFFQWAEQSGRSQYPIKMPKPQKEQRAAPRWLQRNEQNSLLRAVEKSGIVRDIAIVKVLLNTGLRVQELCDLKWSDVTISDRKGALVVRRGKGEKYREVPLNKDARDAFIMAGYAEHDNGSEPVFAGQRGPFTDSGIQAALKKYASMAGLDGLSPHCLRHTFCKRLIDSGIGICWNLHKDHPKPALIANLDLHKSQACAGRNFLETQIVCTGTSFFAQTMWAENPNENQIGCTSARTNLAPNPNCLHIVAGNLH